MQKSEEMKALLKELKPILNNIIDKTVVLEKQNSSLQKELTDCKQKISSLESKISNVESDLRFLSYKSL
jgi:predicted  nucleic acid-binding Zn-ribbon protein